MLGIGLLVLVAAGAAAAFAVLREPGDISRPDVEFVPEAPPPAAPSPKPKPKAVADRFVWPFYGYSADRRRYLPASSSLRPPFFREWVFRARTLLEFTPVLAGERLFLIGNNGRMWALDKRTGRVLWQRRPGALAAESPAYAKGVVCVTLLARAPGMPGRAACMKASTGKYLWVRDLPSRAESSPLMYRGRLYFGTEDGTVYAMRVADGAVRWRYRAHGAVKGGLALANDTLYFGDYTGRVYAITRPDGDEVWQVGTSGARFGLGSGRFYATAAVAYGRVYLGNTDGFVYSFAARTGKLAWRKGTGGYVYGSPAVAQVPGARPLVYVGSYDGTFYALDARSGDVRWRYHDGGKISGGATVIGDVVYFSNVGKKTTTGLGARTGRVLLRSRYGAFHPMISDGRRLFQTGSSALYGLRPVGNGK